jgi:hypothetical protein
VDGSENNRVSSPTKGFSFFAAKLEKGRRNKMSRNKHSHFRCDLHVMIASFPYGLGT